MNHKKPDVKFNKDRIAFFKSDMYPRFDILVGEKEMSIKHRGLHFTDYSIEMRSSMKMIISYDPEKLRAGHNYYFVQDE